MFMKKSFIRSLVLFVLIATSILFIQLPGISTIAKAATTLVTYPAPSGVTLNTTFTVQVRADGGNWQTLDAYQTTIGAAHPSSASFVYFDTDGPVDVSVTYNSGSITSAVIRPTNQNITPTINGNIMTFTISGPMKLSLEVNGEVNHNLNIFANPLEVNPPSPTDSNVIYLGPGVYNQDYTVTSGKTLYIAGGAVVKGAVIMDNATNAKLLGRGVIDHPPGRAISADYANQITIDGIIVNDYGQAGYGGCAIDLGNSTNVTINNFKAYSYKNWTDGIDTFAAYNVTINDCYLRTGDDCIAIYTARQNGGHVWYGDSSNINVTNSILMPDLARPINVGTHGYPNAPGGGYTIDELNFSNLDILLHNPLNVGRTWPIQFACGDGNLIQNVDFTDIRIEDNSTGKICNIATQSTVLGPGRGVNNVYLKNVTFTGNNTNGSNINGYNAGRITQNVTFENLVVNGDVILSASQGNFNVNGYTSNINFIPTGGSVPAPIQYAPPTPINLALGKTASADSSQLTNPVSSGNDGSTTTRWCADDGNTGHWWMVDLGSNMYINGGTQVKWEQSGAVYQYKIETSSDNINWALKVDKTDNTSTGQIQSDMFYDTARYIRITVTGLSSGAYASFYDFKVLGDPCNLALGKTTIVDSTQSGSPASNGNDGNSMTNWSASDGNTGHWWMVDLGLSKNITYGTQVLWPMNGVVYQYKVETSTDNTNWTLRVDKTGNASTDQVQTDYFSGTARYVCITMTGLPSGANASISDFKVLGEATDLALNHNASADSSQSGSPASAGNDGKVLTHWSANDGNTGHYWTVDLGLNVNINNGTQVMWANSGAAYQYKIETSTDNTNWTLQIDKTGNSNSNQVQSDYFTASARYVRITVTGLPSGANASISDFKVFGDEKIYEVLLQTSIVDLTSGYNADAFSYDTNRYNGNFDGYGYTYPAELVVTTPTYKGIPFQLGVVSDGSNNMINCTAQTITLPQGGYNNIWFLAAGSGGDQVGTFQINYTDGTSSTANITVMDWLGANSNLVEAYTHRHSRTADDLVHRPNICAYSLTAVEGKTVSSLTLPYNTRLHIFAMTMTRTSPNFAVDLTSSFNSDGFSYDNNRSNGNYDRHGYSYSADLVNSAPTTADGIHYQFGAMSDGSNNTIESIGQTINLPQGVYSNLWFLGAGSNGNQTGTFQINYTDGTSSTASITMNDWCGFNSNIVESFSHRHSPTADDLVHATYICAYSLTPTEGKEVASLTLPNNSNMHVFAITTVK